MIRVAGEHAHTEAGEVGPFRQGVHGDDTVASVFEDLCRPPVQVNST